MGVSDWAAGPADSRTLRPGPTLPLPASAALPCGSRSARVAPANQPVTFNLFPRQWAFWGPLTQARGPSPHPSLGWQQGAHFCLQCDPIVLCTRCHPAGIPVEGERLPKGFPKGAHAAGRRRECVGQCPRGSCIPEGHEAGCRWLRRLPTRALKPPVGCLRSTFKMASFLEPCG